MSQDDKQCEQPSNIIPFPLSHGADAEQELKDLFAEFNNSERVLLNFKINKSGLFFTITSEYALFPKTDDDSDGGDYA